MTTAPAFSDSAFDPAAGYVFTDVIEAATQPALALSLAEAPGDGPDTGRAWGHTGSSETCPGCTYRCETPETHNWGCPCAPHGPGAARQVAEYHAAQDLHAHLVVDGHDICVSGHCGVPEPTLAGTLL